MIRSRTLKTVVAVAAVAGGLLAARFVVHRIEDRIRADPELFPPAMQIDRQAEQLAAPVAPDPDVGFVAPANERRRLATDDFTFTLVTDRHGFPNPGPWPATADVVFLGDSLLMGFGVGLERGFVELVDEDSPRTDVVNLGVRGAGAARQLRILEKYGLGLEPGLVVACLFLATDLSNDTHFRSWLDDPLGMDYNTFRLGYARRNDTRSRFNPVKRAERHPLYYWFLAAVEPWLRGEHEIVHERRMADGSRLLFDRKKTRFARKRFTGKEPEIRFLFESLARLRALTAARGAALAVVLIPSKEEIFAVEPGANDASAAAVVRAHLRAQGIPYLDLYPVLREAGERRNPYFPRDIHLNAHGNRVVADAFLDWRPASGSGAARR